MVGSIVHDLEIIETFFLGYPIEFLVESNIIGFSILVSALPVIVDTIETKEAHTVDDRMRIAEATIAITSHDKACPTVSSSTRCMIEELNTSEDACTIAVSSISP